MPSRHTPTRFIIGAYDYTPYLKQKTGLQWSRENTNDKDAGRDASNVMHPGVTSHQRKLEVKLGPIPFYVAQQLEHDLENGDDGVQVTYPDILDGCMATRRFYNTSIKAAVTRFTPDGVQLDDVSFSLISIEEAQT